MQISLCNSSLNLHFFPLYLALLSYLPAPIGSNLCSSQQLISLSLSFFISSFVSLLDTHVQWWSRNKRAHGNGAGSQSGGSGAPIAGSSAHNNNNHLRRSNIYTAHPADSIRGLQPLPLPLPLPLPMPPTLAATSASMLSVSPSTAAAAAAANQQQQQSMLQQQQQHQQATHYFHPYHHHHHHAPPPPPPPTLPLPHYPHDCDEDAAYEEPEYHQPQQLQPLQQQHQHQQHQQHHSSSVSMSSVTSSPALPIEGASGSSHHWPQAGTMVVAS